MRHGPVTVGVAIGVALGVASAMLVAGYRQQSSEALAPGPILSECDGALCELVIQYVPEAAPIVATAYRQFLPQLPPEIVVHVVCPDRAAFDDLCSRVGPTACHLRPIFTGHTMTSWARDRWLMMGPSAAPAPLGGRPGAGTIICPRGEAGAASWPQRAGDQLIGKDLAAALVGVRCRVSDLYFDGGDFEADADTVFVTPNVLRRNLQHTVETRASLLNALERLAGKRIVLLDTAPDHHAGMYMMVAPGHTVLVGDPKWGQRLAGSSADSRTPRALCPPEGPDFSDQTAALYDAVARQCAAAGYRVVRIPVVPGVEGRCVMTFVNAITDERGGRHIVYMPVYRGAKSLNEAAAGVWRGLGYEVGTVDCTDTYTQFGGLHCLVNVLRRG